MNGIFITFEGIEGCGKTTQIGLLNDYLKTKGYKTLLTREPGGTIIGDKIRAILLSQDSKGMAPITELLLYAAARNQHLAQVIRPALKKNMVVICDRYADATEAYQGAARNLDSKIVQDVHKIATNGQMPVLTILFDCPVEIGLSRARTRNDKDEKLKNEDRFEQEKLDFHRRVRDGYLTIAKREPERVKVIDATKNIDEIQKDIQKIIKISLPL